MAAVIEMALRAQEAALARVDADLAQLVQERGKLADVVMELRMRARVTHAPLQAARGVTHV